MKPVHVNIPVIPRIVRLDSPTGYDQDYIYHDKGFLRQLQLVTESGIIIAKSPASHPECIIHFAVNDVEFIALPGHSEVYSRTL